MAYLGAIGTSLHDGEARLAKAYYYIAVVAIGDIVNAYTLGGYVYVG